MSELFTQSDLRVLAELGDLQKLADLNFLGQERSRPLVMGSSEGVRATINRLDGWTSADQATGRQVVTIPRSGILITPEQGGGV